MPLPPGPRIPGVVQTLRYTFDQPRFFAEQRRRFGPTWTLRLPGFPPAVITSDREAIKRLLTGDPLTKRHANDLLRPILGDGSMLLLEPAPHLARRKLELPPFHGEAVRAYADRIRELAEAEVATWRGTVETHPRARALTLDIILELVLGVRDRSLRADLGEIFEGFQTRRNNLGQFLPPKLTTRRNPATWPFYRQRDRLYELLEAHIRRTREDPSGADMLALLVRAKDEDGIALSDGELRDELFTLVIAGHETTATAIAWGCDRLAHAPAVAARLRDELAGGDRTYLRATAKEVLRARSVAYVSAARVPLVPVQVGDWTIGPDAIVLVDAQGLHGDPSLHPDPEAFRPERFIGEQPDGYAYLPFGGGAHRCLGAALAMLELETALEAIVTRYELAPDGPPAKPVRRGVTLAPDNGGRVRVERLVEQPA